MSGERGPAGAAGATGATGPAGPPGPAGAEAEATAHIEHATIQVDEADMTQGARRAARLLAYSLCVLFVFMIGIGLANLLFTASQVHNVQQAQALADQNSALLRRQVLADCGEQADLAGLPLTNLPGKNYPSVLGVRIISDARAAWFGHGCPGHLPAPTASFLAGAAFYHIPVVRDGR